MLVVGSSLLSVSTVKYIWLGRALLSINEHHPGLGLVPKDAAFPGSPAHRVKYNEE